MVRVDRLYWWGSLIVVAGLIVLPGVPLALAGRDHSHLVGPGGAVLALKLDALSSALVVDAPPLL